MITVERVTKYGNNIVYLYIQPGTDEEHFSHQLQHVLATDEVIVFVIPSDLGGKVVNWIRSHKLVQKIILMMENASVMMLSHHGFLKDMVLVTELSLVEEALINLG